jgi:hypothetical protein
MLAKIRLVGETGNISEGRSEILTSQGILSYQKIDICHAH